MFGAMYAAAAQVTCTTGGQSGFSANNGGSMYADLSVVNGADCAIAYDRANGGTIIDP